MLCSARYRAHSERICALRSGCDSVRSVQADGSAAAEHDAIFATGFSGVSRTRTDFRSAFAETEICNGVRWPVRDEPGFDVAFSRVVAGAVERFLTTEGTEDHRVGTFRGLRFLRMKLTISSIAVPGWKMAATPPFFNNSISWSGMIPPTITSTSSM